MRQVHVIEDFEDLVWAFNFTRPEGDKSPQADIDDKLFLYEGGRMVLQSKKLMLSDAMRTCGVEFVRYCIGKTFGGKWAAETLET